MTVTSETVTSQGANLTIVNNSQSTSHDALIMQVVVNGAQRLFWVPLTLRPGQGGSVLVTFLQPVDSPIVIGCGNYPIGIVETPDPVVCVTVTSSN